MYVIFKWNVVIRYGICVSPLTAIVEIIMQRAMGQKFMSVALLLETLFVRTLPKLAYRIPPNSYADKCICVVSRSPSFRVLKDALEELFALCFSSTGSRSVHS